MPPPPPAAPVPPAPAITPEIHATLRAARIAAVAAIIAAVISLGSALISGIFDSDRSLDEFLRTQRQAQYAAFVSNLDVLTSIEGATDWSQASRQQSDELWSAYRAVATGMAQIEILGDDEVLAALNELGQDIGIIMGRSLGTYCASNNDITSPQCSLTFTSNEEPNYYENRGSLVAAMREELDVD